MTRAPGEHTRPVQEARDAETSRDPRPAAARRATFGWILGALWLLGPSSSANASPAAGLSMPGSATGSIQIDLVERTQGTIVAQVSPPEHSEVASDSEGLGAPEETTVDACRLQFRLKRVGPEGAALEVLIRALDLADDSHLRQGRLDGGSTGPGFRWALRWRGNHPGRRFGSGESGERAFTASAGTVRPDASGEVALEILLMPEATRSTAAGTYAFQAQVSATPAPPPPGLRLGRMALVLPLDPRTPRPWESGGDVWLAPPGASARRFPSWRGRSLSW